MNKYIKWRSGDCPRQGDLVFVPLAKGTVEVAHVIAHHKPRKNGVIQEGEGTGHDHCLLNLGDAQVFRPEMGKPIIIVGNNGAPIKHRVGPGEKGHGLLTDLKPNTEYRVHRGREFDIVEGVRYVAD